MPLSPSSSRRFFQTAGGASNRGTDVDPVGPVAAVVGVDQGDGDSELEESESGDEEDEDSDGFVPPTQKANFVTCRPDRTCVGVGSNLFPVMVLVVKVEGPPPGKKLDRKRLRRAVPGNPSNGRATRETSGEREPVARAEDGSPACFRVDVDVAQRVLAGGSPAELHAVFGDVTPDEVKQAGFTQLFHVLGDEDATTWADFDFRKGRPPGTSVGRADRSAHLKATRQPFPVAGRTTPTDVLGCHLDASGKVMTPKKARGNPNQTAGGQLSSDLVPGPPPPVPVTPPTLVCAEDRLAVVSHDRNSNRDALKRKRKPQQRLQQTKLTPKLGTEPV